MTTARNRSSLFLVNAAVLVALLPVLVIPAVVWWSQDVVPRLNESLPLHVWPDVFALASIPLCVVALAVAILWKGRVGAGLFLCLMILIGLQIAYFSRQQETHTAEFGVADAVQGITVECNGVVLGKTPFTISMEEFFEKVPQWDTPPRQPTLELEQAFATMGNVYQNSTMSYVPGDIFGETVKCGEVPWWWKDETVRPKLRESHYWWHFSMDGCTGLARIPSVNTSASSINPSVEFPSLKRQLELVIADLRQHGGVPTPEWLAYFAKYQDLLFVDFYVAAQKDPVLLAGLRSAVRADFRIPEEPSEEDVERVVDDVLDRVERRKGFLMPSPESAALDLLGAQGSDLIAKKYLEVIDFGPGFRVLRCHTGNWSLTARDGSALRQLPLEHVLKQYPVPSLFNRLVYEAARRSERERFLPLVAAYDRPEVEPIVKEYLLPFRSGRSLDQKLIQQMIAVAADTVNPNVEEDFRFVIQRYGTGDPFLQSEVERFIKSRIDAPRIDQAALANWILHFAPIADEKKVEYLVRIKAPDVGRYVYILTSRNPMLGEQAICLLAAEPNPNCAYFLVMCCQDLAYRQLYRDSATALCTAVAKTDTPEVREFVTNMWNEMPDSREAVLGGLNAGRWEGPRPDWITPLLSTLTTEEERYVGMGVLAKIGSDEALATIARWVEEGSPELKQRARELEEERRAKEAKEQEDVRLAEELIAGRIKPDDLIEERKAYVWNGEDYVVEEGNVK